MDMIFPFESLSGLEREFGLLVAVLIGFGFGFVLERAGFGRSTKLAAQFYFYDMTVFKVMFSAIVTAMIGVIVAGGLGLVDIGHVSELVVSGTFIWPMIFGGLLLGVGFIISGYCPGTSLVSSASGNVDGIFAFVGVIVGSVLLGLVQPHITGFFSSGDMGQVFLYELLGIQPAILALIVAVMAIGCFLGAEIVERIATRILSGADRKEAPAAPRRFAIALFGAAGLVGVLLLFLPVGRDRAVASDQHVAARDIPVSVFARRMIDKPWMLRIIDIRPNDAFLKQRIPGSEHADPSTLGDLGLQYSRGIRDLVLVDESGKVGQALPEAVRAYPGRVLVLEGGFEQWRQFALTEPTAPSADASPAAIDAYRFQSAIHTAMTGAKAPPPPKRTTKFKAPPKRKGGGCS